MLSRTNRLSGLTEKAPALVNRVRFQYPAGFGLGVALPVLLRTQGQFGVIDQVSSINTAIASAFAYTLAFYSLRRLGGFPGITYGSPILFSTSMSYMLASAIFLVFRFDYSISILAASYAIATLWFIALGVVSRRNHQFRLAVVPGGPAAEFGNSAGVRAIPLEAPGRLPPGVGAVVADLRQDFTPEWRQFLLDCSLAGIPVYHHKQIREMITGKVEIDHLSENTWGSLLPSNAYLKMKLLIDRLVAVAVLPFVLLALAVVAPLIKLSSPGPIFYAQSRIGYRGAPFTVYKLRTMRQLTGEEARARALDREAAVTNENDDRVTAIGRILRRYRIDELPQILNILKGDMSWIGPRPEAIALSDWYEDELPFYRYRLVVRPGISGWAQIHQGHVASPAEVLDKLYYDFFYIKYLSPWLDLLIAVRTVRAVLGGFGAK